MRESVPGLSPPSSGLRHSWACSWHSPYVVTSSFPNACLSLYPNFPFYKNTNHTRLGPIQLPHLNLIICKDYFQIGSHSRVLRTSTSFGEGHSATHNPGQSLDFVLKVTPWKILNKGAVWSDFCFQKITWVHIRRVTYLGQEKQRHQLVQKFRPEMMLGQKCPNTCAQVATALG